MFRCEKNCHCMSCQFFVENIKPAKEIAESEGISRRTVERVRSDIKNIINNFCLTERDCILYIEGFLFGKGYDHPCRWFTKGSIWHVLEITK